MWGLGILNGLRITMRNLRRGSITVMYPYEKLDIVAELVDAQGLRWGGERSHWRVGQLVNRNKQAARMLAYQPLQPPADVGPDHLV